MEENNALNNSDLSPNELQSLLAVMKANKAARLQLVKLKALRKLIALSIFVVWKKSEPKMLTFLQQ